MPIYEYECVSKGHVFDRLQKLSDPDPETCEVCGAAPVRRRVTAPAFRLAGSGWYETDFKSDKDKRRNLAGDGAAASSGGGAEASASSSGSSESSPAKAASSGDAASS